MATNKFATMLHRNCNKITVTLVYAVLEWILIYFLLLNSCFSYLIGKFAKYFGLKQPCLWCSRVEHILEPSKTKNKYGDLVCEAHAKDISRLSYCASHQKWVESPNMCTECSSFQQVVNVESIEIPQKIAFFTWVSENRMNSGEKNCKCSCCDENLRGSKLCSSYLLLKLKPSWAVLEYTKNGNLIEKATDDDTSGGEHITQDDGCQERVADDHQTLSDVESFSLREAIEEDCARSGSISYFDMKEGNECEIGGVFDADEQQLNHMDFIQRPSAESSDHSVNTRNCSKEDQLLRFMDTPSKINYYDCIDRLTPTELIDSSTFAIQKPSTCREADLGEEHEQLDEKWDAETHARMQKSAQEATATCDSVEAALCKIYGTLPECLDSGKSETLSTLMAEQGKQTSDQIPYTDENNLECGFMNEPAAENDDICNFLGDETVSRTITQREVFGNEPANQNKADEPAQASPSLKEDQCPVDNEQLIISCCHGTSPAETNRGVKQLDKAILSEEYNDCVASHLEAKELEEEKYAPGPQELHKKLLFEKRESGNEESWDGSVISELEGEDGALTIEKLKAAVKAQSKALSAMYAELEEERSAAAIAANQTMAMITRLQEEKAAMQMEALQYQRMMEEQSEYDQEALQLLNELMAKRDKERQELEKELGMYREKIQLYETREKINMMRANGSTRSRNSSSSFNNLDKDSDGMSSGIDREDLDDDGNYLVHQGSGNQNSCTDTVLEFEEVEMICTNGLSKLNESLAEFEEERQSILEGLQRLDERLFKLDDDEELFYKDIKPLSQSTENYGREFDENDGFSIPEENGVSGGRTGKHCPQRKAMAFTPKRLLPLFDATSVDSKEGKHSEEEAKSHIIVNELEVAHGELTIEEELGHLYERLEALEADREFLNHCVSSLRKGDKGVDLLQEILQHFHDLRSLELHARNMDDNPSASCNT